MSLGLASRLPDGFLARVGAAKGDVLGQGAGEEKHVLLDGGDLRAKRFEVPVAHIHAVYQHPAGIDGEDAVDELGECRLARSCLSHDGDGLSRLGGEADVVQHRLAIVAEADILENHFPLDRPSDTLLVLVQFRFRVDHFQDPLGASHAQLHQVEGENRDERGEAKRAH